MHNHGQSDGDEETDAFKLLVGPTANAKALTAWCDMSEEVFAEGDCARLNRRSMRFGFEWPNPLRVRDVSVTDYRCDDLDRPLLVPFEEWRVRLSVVDWASDSKRSERKHVPWDVVVDWVRDGPFLYIESMAISQRYLNDPFLPSPPPSDIFKAADFGTAKRNSKNLILALWRREFSRADDPALIVQANADVLSVKALYAVAASYVTDEGSTSQRWRQQAAIELGISEAAVRTRLAKAKEIGIFQSDRHGRNRPSFTAYGELLHRTMCAPTSGWPEEQQADIYFRLQRRMNR